MKFAQRPKNRPIVTPTTPISANVRNGIFVIFAAITPPMITPTSPPWKLMPPSLNARIFSGC